ncbi:MAG: hypothetical protein ABIP20_10585 [Chthoniobacteraceae bacterium]
MSSPNPQSEELFRRLLDESAARLAATEGAGIAIPDDDLHRDIIVPLLPAMLGDKSIRQHWSEQAATGFPARLARHLDGGEPAPRWLPGDFEIHVTASYSAGADARALADTLLSEDSLREMAATLMNQLLDVLWPSLAPAPAVAPAEPEPAVGISPVEISEPEIPEPIVFSDPEPVVVPVIEIADALQQPASEPRPEPETRSVQPPPSRGIVRALCRKLPASAAQRGLIANRVDAASAAILARRICVRAATSQPRLPRRASL